MRDKDGHIYCFVSFARGPCLSQEAMEQIFAIYYALSIAPNAERVIRTHDLVPEYDEKMEKLTVLRHYETLDIIESMISETNLESIRDANNVQEIPADVIINFPVDEGNRVERVVQLGEVFLAPVRTRMHVEADVGEGEFFWRCLHYMMFILFPRRLMFV